MKAKGWFGLVLFAACAPSGDAIAPPAESKNEACVPGEQSACACPNGDEGVQLCNDDGSAVGACSCEGSSGTGMTEPCGDGTCAADEDCHRCAADCGACEPCDVAPSCDGAQVPPTDLPHVMDFDVPAMQLLGRAELEARLRLAVAEAGPAIRTLAAALDDRAEPGEHLLVTRLREVFVAHPAAAAALKRQLDKAGMGAPARFRKEFPLRVEPRFVQRDGEFDGGTLECGAPRLRVAVTDIVVHEEDDDVANDIVYCVIQAEAEQASEIRITPQTPNLDEGDTHSFALESGVFWGQHEPTTPGSNLLLTYDCIEADTSDGYQQLVSAIGQAAHQAGNVVEGDNGWIFSTAAAIAPVVSSGLALDQDDKLFNAQQTIPIERHLELTNGGYWTVRRDGTHLWSDWDWELVVKTWGCAEYGTL